MQNFCYLRLYCTYGRLLLRVCWQVGSGHVYKAVREELRCVEGSLALFPWCSPALADLRMAGVCLAADKFWCVNRFYGCGDRFWFAVAHCRLLRMRLYLAAMSLVFRKRSGPCDHDGAMIAVTCLCVGLSGDECAAVIVFFHLWLHISKHEKREQL